jgi:hypothetical protein
MRFRLSPVDKLRLVVRPSRLAQAGLVVASACLVRAVLTAGGADSAAAPPPDSVVHFTVTSDLHCRTNIYSCILDAMQAYSGGQGAFQISVGDVTDTAGQTPAGLRKLIDAHFGAQAVWYPAVGNHDTRGGKSSTSMKWRRDEYYTGNGTRTPLKDLVTRPGPKGSLETTYSWDCGNAHLVVLNEYWNGRTAAGSGTATDGDIVPALRSWLEADLAANNKPFTFVFGHEPAFAEHRHVGNSLDGHAANRHAFWAVLKKYHVQAFISGHIHFYYKELRDGVYQISDGNAGKSGGEKHQSYLDVLVGPDQAQIQVWQNTTDGSTAWHLADTISLQPAR